MTTAATPLTWLSDEELTFPNASLLCVYDERTATLESTPDLFILVKSRQMIDWYSDRFEHSPPRTVLEIGILKGGSVVLFAELWRPERLVAVDISAKPIEALAEYARSSCAATGVRPVYGIDQADRAAMQGVRDAQFRGDPIDLIIDDGCHYLEESRATFNSTFPYLAPGGSYVIEDWAWAHWPGIWQEGGGPWRDRPAATYLALELAMLSASRPDIVKSVEITRDLIVVTKGSCADLPADFDLQSHYLTAGKVFIEYGFAHAGQVEGRAIVDAQAQIAHLYAQLRAVQGTTSWRLTAPLRRVGRLLGRGRDERPRTRRPRG